jgi:hypothetical protein
MENSVEMVQADEMTKLRRELKIDFHDDRKWADINSSNKNKEKVIMDMRMNYIEQKETHCRKTSVKHE